VDQVASNDPRAAACGRVEVRLRTRPCLTAIEQLSSIILDDLDLDSDDRWPEWKQVARSFGFSSFLALPGYVYDTTTVALNVYGQHPGSWRRQEIDLHRHLRPGTRRHAAHQLPMNPTPALVVLFRDPMWRTRSWSSMSTDDLQRAGACTTGRPLTVRERVILEALHRDETLEQIARRLFVTRNTVKTQVRSLYRKIGVSTRAEAVRWAAASSG